MIRTAYEPPSEHAQDLVFPFLISSKIVMASNRGAVVVALVLIGILAMSHTSEAAGKKNCGKDPLTPLRPCIKSVIGNRPAAPDAACCAAVKKADLDCICQAFTSNSVTLPAGIKVNKKAAFALPKRCKRSIPQNYKCKGIKF